MYAITAKEASKRIVEDLLFTAGANDTTDDLPIEQSPSIIQRVERLEDETF
jgi:DASH complex subunit ASK1